MKRFFNSPAILILIAMIAINLIDMRGIDAKEWIMTKLLMLPGIIIGISFHEFAHGLASHALGDPTPKQQGRLTINPMAHLEPFGFAALFLAGFGWGKPVEINPSYYKHRRSAEIIVAMAGVIMNLVLAVVFAFIGKFLILEGGWINSDIGNAVIKIIRYTIQINIVLMIFNLLPIPPLDGFGIITELFNLRRYSWYYTVYNNGFMILLLLIFFNITDRILIPLVIEAYQIILTIVGV